MASNESLLEGSFLTPWQSKISLTGSTLLAYILPPLVCQYVMAVLVQLKGTRYYRLALLPILLLLAGRGTFVDATGDNPRQVQANTVLITHMCSISMRATVWAFARQPFRRRNLSEKQHDRGSESVYTVFWNAWDLMLNLRGIGWNWSRGLVLPKPTFETNSRAIFLLLLAAQLALHVFVFDACLQGIRILSPETFGSVDGGSLFDHTLPPHLELLRAVFVSLLTAAVAYFALSHGYLFLAIVCTIVFQQHPSEWPPLFDSPWSSTSLSELWGRRWHQMMREPLVGLGARPFKYLFGSFGGLFGAFLVSGIFHDIELRSCGRGGNSVTVIGFWVMNSVGVGLERVWKKTTGKPVDGVWGRVWTFGWLVLWGVPMVNEWAKVGRFGALSLPGQLEPSLALVSFVRECWKAVGH